MVDAAIQFLSAQGVMLVYGVTALMLAGAAVALCARGSAAVLRQRACEMGVLAALAWLVLACVPLPRMGWGGPGADGSVDGSISGDARKPLTLSALEIPRELIAKPQAGRETVLEYRSLLPSQAVAVIAPRTELDWRAGIARVFVVGAAGCAGWLVLGQALLWRLVRRSVSAPEAVWRIVDARLRPGRSRPAVQVTLGLSRPVTCGVWRPTVLLPPALLEEGCARQLRQVLLHELGHVQQRDGWGNLLFCVALPVLYFHPLYWWLRRSASLARELVADDWAARADGKEAYVSELVALARTRMTGMAGPIGAIGILQNRSHFYWRMRMLLQRQIPLATRCSNRCRAALAMVTVMAVVVMAAMIGVTPARGQTAAPAAPGAAAEKGAADRAIGPQDYLEITMTEPAGGGVKSVVKAQVNEKGNVTLPLIGSVKAAGVTREELEKAIAQSYRDKNLIQNAKVSVKFIEKGQTPKAAGAGARKAIDELTTNQIGMVDPFMKRILAERDAIADRIAELRAKGLGDDQPEIAKARDELALAEKKIQLYAREWREMQMQMQKDAAQRPGAATAIPLLPAPGAQAQQSAAAVGGVQLDLVNLANSLVDAAGAVRLAKLKVSAAGAIGQLEAATAQSNLQTAVKRLELLKGIASIALEAAKTDAKRAEQLYKQGVENAQAASEANSKMKMLELIVKGVE
jgi:beta-lactamase regulating signal transducer with metallopeptidase domain